MTNKVTFTKAMAKDYTILIPMMCPIHFELVKNVLVNSRYKVELLTNTGHDVIDTGLKYVHNDTCYPALLVIGQMINALQSGNYDLHKTALIITQTGGGCRASNYIYLLRKALKKADLEYIPVISLNFSGLDKQPGFKLDLKTVRCMLAAVVYGDLLMDLFNQCQPYEINEGQSAALVAKWIKDLSAAFKKGEAISRKAMDLYLKDIACSFNEIPLKKVPKVRVGIVGEIYIKYSPLGNNDLESFLRKEDCEIKVPGLIGFALYCIYNAIEDHKLYSGSLVKLKAAEAVYHYALDLEASIIKAIQENTSFDVPSPFDELIEEASKVINIGTKMGEGWLLTGEMLELNKAGFKNIICAQPFGCLPNHIVGKGMIRKIKELDPSCNIVPIDYDPGASSVNQENRIKLMLAIAKEELEKTAL